MAANHFKMVIVVVYSIDVKRYLDAQSNAKVNLKIKFFFGASRAFFKYMGFIATLNLKMTRSEHDLRVHCSQNYFSGTCHLNLLVNRTGMLLLRRSVGLYFV